MKENQTARFVRGCIRSQTTYLSYLLTKNVVRFGSGYRWEKCEIWEWVSVRFGSGLECEKQKLKSHTH